MSFSSIVDAQIQIISSVLARNSLEVDLASYNDTNDANKLIRLGIKTQIKEQQVIIDSANNYLIASGTAPLRYSSATIALNGFVITPWDNESSLVNTVKYNILQYDDLTVPEIKSTLVDATSLVVDAGKRVAEKKEKLEEIKKNGSTILLSDAQADFDLSNENLKLFVQNKNNIEENLKNVMSQPLEERENTFSHRIRHTIRNSLAAHSEFDGLLLEVEAAVVMRKKALDALYTAKTPEEIAIAKDRLHRASTLEGPITKKVISYNPTARTELFDSLNETENVVLTTSISLSAAQTNLFYAIESEVEADISAAQIVADAALGVYKSAQHERLAVVDKLLGFADSKNPASMYAGTITYAEVEGQYFDNTTKSTETVETKQALDHVDTEKLANTDNVYDTKEKKYINRSDMQTNESGRYIETRTVSEFEEARYTASRDKQTKIFNNTTNVAKRNIEKENKKYQDATVDYVETNHKLQTDRDKAVESGNSKKVADIDKELHEQNTNHDAAMKTRDTNIAQYEVEIVDRKIEYDANLKANNIQYQYATQASQVPASQDEARAVVASFDKTVDQSNKAEVNFNKSYKLAVDRARAANPNTDPNYDPKDSTNWSPQDKAVVDQRLVTLNTTRQNELQAAVRLDQYTNVVPGGRETLVKSGLTEDDINRRLVSGNDSVSSIRSRNNSTINDFGTAANSLEGSNIRTANGFESINNGAPFYLQMPTLNSLKDFHINNGKNPYGNGTLDDVARDGIHFNIFEIAPPAPKAVLVPGQSGLIRNQVDPATTNTIGSFTIYPHSHDYLKMTHNHSYTSNSGITSIVNTTLGVIDGLDVTASLLSVGIDSALKGVEQGIPQKVSRSLDQLDTYSGSEKLNLTIDFKLFTRKDFLSDIFKPLMFLTALSYPKRQLSGDLGTTLAKAAKNSQNLINETEGADPFRPIVNATANGINSSAEFIDKYDTKLATFGGVGPFRYYITKRPEYISVRHASGLFHFQLAAILEVSYSFEGPWYNADGKEIPLTGKVDEVIRANLNDFAAQSGAANTNLSLKERFAAIGSTAEKAIQDLKVIIKGGDRPKNYGGVDTAFSSLSKMAYAYPSIANCTIRVANLTQTFRDDYLSLMEAAGNGGNGNGGGIVSISESQTGTVPPNRRSTDDFRQIS